MLADSTYHLYHTTSFHFNTLKRLSHVCPAKLSTINEDTRKASQRIEIHKATCHGFIILHRTLKELLRHAGYFGSTINLTEKYEKLCINSKMTFTSLALARTIVERILSYSKNNHPPIKITITILQQQCKCKDCQC